MLSEFVDGTSLWLPRKLKLQVFQACGDALAMVYLGRLFAGGHELLGTTEDERMTDRSTTDHHGIGTRHIKGALHVLRRLDIAIQDYGNVHNLLDLRDPRPVCLSVMPHITGTTVYGQGCSAGIFDHPRYIQDHDGVAAPTQARLHRDGTLAGVDDGARKSLHLWRILQKGSSGIAYHHVLHPAAEVNVDEVRTRFLGPLCRLDHHVDIAAKDLNGHRTFLFGQAQLLHRTTGVPDEAVAGDKLGVHDVCAVSAADQAEGEVGNVLHRRKQDSLLHLYMSNAHAQRYPSAPVPFFVISASSIFRTQRDASLPWLGSEFSRTMSASTSALLTP